MKERQLGLEGLLDLSSLGGNITAELGRVGKEGSNGATDKLPVGQYRVSEPIISPRTAWYSSTEALDGPADDAAAPVEAGAPDAAFSRRTVTCSRRATREARSAVDISGDVL